MSTNFFSGTNGTTASAVTVTVNDGSSAETAAERVPWEGILALEGSPTADRRYLIPGEVTERDLPLPFAGSHEDQYATETAGRIESITRIPIGEFDKDGFDLPDDLPPQAVVIWGTGSFSANQNGRDALDDLENGVGVSLDLPPSLTILLDASTFEEVDPTTLDPDTIMGLMFGIVPEGYLLGVGGKIGGASLASIAAFEEASIRIVDGHALVASGYAIRLIPAPLTASAAGRAPLKPSRDWFFIEEPDEPQPLTVTDDGQVFFHLSTWDTCHTGFPETCVISPRSASNYAYFHVGEIETSEGERVAVGKLMLGGKHAPRHASRAEASKHYDDCGKVGAFLRIVDGQIGPWACGAINPSLDPELVRDIKANPPSGDWRSVNGALELVAALSVPVPGFPIPRAEAHIVASGEGSEVVSLIASGIEVPARQLTREERRAIAKVRKALAA